MDIVKIIFWSLLLFQATYGHNDCSPQSCGKNPSAVRFPFWLQGQQQQRQQQNCGYPGFGLSCSIHQPDDTMVLNLPNAGDFGVGNIDYLVQKIQLFDPNGCIQRRLLSLNLSASPFMAATTQNFTFLSCPASVVAQFNTIDCLSNSTASVLATSSSHLVRAMNMCSTFASLAVPVSSEQVEEGDSLSSDLGEDLWLTWNVPDCQGCEARGGTCGFENSTSSNIMCFTDQTTGHSGRLKIFKIIAFSGLIPVIACIAFVSCFTIAVAWRMRRNPDASQVPPPPPSLPRAVDGIDESIIESYKEVVLGESRRMPGLNGSICPICLADYHPRDMVRCIPKCEHCFHSGCIDEWLRMQNTCPVCRNSPSVNQGTA